MAIPSPKMKRWRGVFEGEYSGEIWHAKNIDLVRAKGKVTIGDSLTAKAVSTSLTNLTTPVAFLRTAADSTDRYWALGGKLFKTTNTDPETGWAEDAISNTPSAPLWDLIEFGGAMLVPTATNIDRLASGTWDNTWWTDQAGTSALTTGKPHRFAIHAAALLITDGRYVHTWDGTIATQNALTLPSGFDAQFIIVTSDTAWIGTKALNGGDTDVFSWDRANDSYTGRFPIGSSECLAGFVYGGVPYIITKRGHIKRHNGIGFTVENGGAVFPTVELEKDISELIPNGVAVDGDVVRINVNFGTIADWRLRSGVWIFEPKTGNLYHSAGVKNNASADYSQNEIAAAGAIKLTLPTQGRFLVGARPYTVYSGTSIYGIFTYDESSSANRGYLITPKIKAANARNFWREFIARFGNMLSSTDRIRCAYRTTDSTVFPAFETITWVTATTFTASNANLAVGDFVEILAGDNAGAIAKITTKTGAGAPWTFTIDLTLNASTNTARAQYFKMTDLGTVSSQAVQENTFRPAVRAGWIQYLIELRGGITSPQVEDLIPDYDGVPR